MRPFRVHVSSLLPRNHPGSPPEDYLAALCRACRRLCLVATTFSTLGSPPFVLRSPRFVLEEMTLHALPLATSPIDDASLAPPAAPPLQLGGDATAKAARTVGDYVLLRSLGAGAVGRVKLARHVVTGGLVAVKVIRKSLLRSQPALGAKVRREIAVLKLLGGAAGMEHGGGDVGVLKLYDVYETEQCWLLVLEYCSGGDLFDAIMQHGYMDPPQALDYFQQLVLALHFSHRHGITHRDLKLENLLIDGCGRLRLADFGMSSLMRPGSLLETACGSPNYCAPEVLSGELYDGARSDCWSLGVILYAMLTGGLPFDDDNFSRLVAKVRSGIFFIPDEVHPGAANLIRALLIVDPDARATLDHVLADPWFASAPLPAHMRTLHAAVPRSAPLTPETPPPDTPLRPPQSSPCALSPAADSLDEELERLAAAAPIPDPAMPIVVNLTELGLGEIPTILRRLRSDRRCLEKDFYRRIAAFVARPGCSRSLDGELPPSPNGASPGPARGRVGVAKELVGSVLPVSVADGGPPAPLSQPTDSLGPVQDVGGASFFKR